MGFHFQILGIMLLSFLAQSIHANPVQLPDIEHCRRQITDPTKSQRTSLANLVGMGWDNLRNQPMATIFIPTFQECKTTVDDQFWVPDGLNALPVQKVDLDRVASFYSDYHQYFDSTRDTVNVDPDLGKAPISGKYSSEHKELKEHASSHNTSIFQTRFRFHYATLTGSMTGKFHPGFKGALTSLGQMVKKNDTLMVEYLSRVIVLGYGTHVIIRADIGAQIAQNDYIKIDSITDKTNTIEKYKAEASVSFFEAFKLGVKFNRDIDKRTQDGFYSSVHHTEVIAKGGANVKRLLTGTVNGTAGADLAVDDVVPLDRHGKPLFYVITPNNLPEEQPEIVYQMAQSVRRAIEEYYTRNTRYGCTNSSAENFDINANVDDGTCSQPLHKYTFGGFYQTCQADGQQYEGSFNCYPYIQPNKITNGFSCPTNYTAVELFVNMEVLTNCYETERYLIFFKRRYTHTCSHRLTTYWCNASAGATSLLQNSGFMFGGLYSQTQINPYTGGYSCPGRFMATRMFFDIFICLSREYPSTWDPRDQKYAVHLGHWFSCNTTANESRCPYGYNQLLATIVGGCEVYYCIRPERDDKPVIMDAHLPPYGQFVFREPVLGDKVNQATPLNIPGIVLGVIVFILAMVVFALVIAILHPKGPLNRNRPDNVGRDHIGSN